MACASGNTGRMQASDENTSDIFAYRDFRRFLSAHAERQKLQRPRWSFGSWARQLGLSGTASLTMVIRGQRLPGPKLTDKLVRYFRFDRRAATHFRSLVALERARKDPESYVAMAERLAAQRPPGDTVFLDDAAFSIVASWHHYAIREMTLLADFAEDACWISGRLGGRVPPHACREALRQLIDAGLLVRGNDGRLHPKAATVAAGNSGMKSLAVRRFHGSVLDLAKHALEKEPLARRTFAGSTICVHASAVDTVRALIDKFQDEIQRVAEAAPGTGDEVYQLALQFVPLTAPRAQADSP